MHTATRSIPAPRSRGRLLAAVLAAACLLGLVAASSAGAWGIGVLHTSLYGAAGHGPGDLVSPYDGRGDTFARESGGNAYSIQVTNTGLGTATTLTCEPGAWTGAGGFEYQWYRDGAAIAGATTSNYVTAAADEGSALQCAVTATNAGPGKFTAYTTPRLVGNAAPAGLPRRGAPTLSASAAGNAGSNLTCNPNFGWRWPSFSYRWLRNGAPIDAATGRTYTIQAGDAPAAIQCVVTAANAAGSVSSASAAQLTATPPSPAAPSTSAASGPSIEGGTSAAGGSSVGQKLSCAGGPASAVLSYQWLRNGSPIASGTAPTYTLLAADQGRVIQCQVTAAGAETSALATSSTTVVFPAPALTPPGPVTPTVSGTLNFGQTLTCGAGSWSGASPILTYQWLRNGAPIAAATSSTYVVAAADVATNLQCQVTGTNAGGAAIAQSADKPISGLAPNTATAANGPTLTGTPAFGNSLTCGAGTWANGPSFSFEWLRNGTPIAGATTSTYVVVAEDEGKALQCQVTADNTQTKSLGVSARAIVSPAPGTSPPSLTTAGTLTGTAAVGSELSCKIGTWANTPTSYTFQILRNGAPISGATLTSASATELKYPIVLADLGKTLQCMVAASNAGGTAVGIATLNASVRFVNAATPPVATAALSAPDTVSVAVGLPAGMKLVGATPFASGQSVATDDDLGFEPGPAPNGAFAEINALGWSCNIATVTCSRSSTLAAGDSYPPIILHVNPGGAGTPDLVAPVITVSGGGPAPATVTDPTEIAPEVPFGVRSFTAEVQDESRHPYSLAGGHPYSAQTDIRGNGALTPSKIIAVAGGDIHDVAAELPPGFTANPQNFPKCPGPIAASGSASKTECPLNTAVGIVEVSLPQDGRINSGTANYDVEYAPTALLRSGPLWNVDPDRGLPAELAFRINGNPYFLEAHLRSDGDYGLSVGSKKVSREYPINGALVTICASGVVFQAGRYECAPSAPDAAPFINNPSKCAGEAPQTGLKLDSWQREGDFVEMGAYVGAPSAPYSYFGRPTRATPVPGSYLTGCAALSELFQPTLSFQPDTTRADSPAGADVALHIPQTNRQDTPMSPALKKTVVTLPDGLTLNTAAGNGLGACSEEQIGLIGTGFPAPNPIHFDQSPIECPDSSKIGTLAVESPLLSEPLDGTVYLAAQKDNPFGSNFAIYLGIDDAKTGLVIKLPGKIDANLGSGRLTATFDDNPQLPLENFRLHFFGGSQASLATPATCGEKKTTTQMVPWSAADPYSPTAAETRTPGSAFEVESGCAGSAAQLPFGLGLDAGSLAPVAGATTPFSFRITRPDGAQELSTLSLSPPAGLAAHLQSVSPCPEGAIEAAKSKTGKAEQASPSCPPGSEVGTAMVGAGAGATPFYTSGKLYMAGPYRGAPLSVVAITPAVAGPFDLGDVVVRSAIYVDPTTARITAKTDSLPQILEGVPLRIRDIRVNLNRPDWTLNPTSCNPMSVDATATGSAGATTNLTTRFQVGGCKDLAFEPDLKIQLHGATKRGKYQRLVATLTARPGEANLSRAAVTLPHSSFLAQEHIRTVCTRVQFAAHQCPKGSIYGHVTAFTRILDEPFTGPIYLRSSSNPLPDLVMALRGPDSMPIEAEVVGRIDSKNGGIRNSFEMVPDVPLSRVIVSLQGGKKSLIVNSRNLCSGRQRATVRLNGQNGKARNSRPVVKNDCRKKGKKGRNRKHHSAAK